MHLILFLNRSAGTLRGVDVDAFATELSDIFAARGHRVDVEAPEDPSGLADAIRACGESSCDAVVVGGGDGTVSSAAALAAERGVALGVLPLGTMNLFARSLGVPLDGRQAAAALAEGERAAVDIGEVNGRYFVHHVTLGLHPRMIRTRERMAYGSRLGKIVASGRALWMATRRPPRLTIDVIADEIAFTRRTAAILVSNNPLGEGFPLIARDPSRGVFGVYVTTARRRQDLVGLTGRLLLGEVAENPFLEEWRARSVEIVLPRPSDWASVDGEIVSLSTPLRFRQHERGLAVLRPRAAERATR